MFYDQIRQGSNGIVLLAPNQHNYPRAASIGLIAINKEVTKSIKPNYVRKSQAEVSYEEKYGETVL